jgi:DNA topoisomerase IB
VRLRRSDLSGPGITRRRSGKGFTYRDPDGRRLDDADTLARIKDLVIPPAWRKVWISPYANGHIQAVGTDAAGRRQYLYHQA